LTRDDRGASVYESAEPVFVRDGNDRYYLDATNLTSCRPKVAWLRQGLEAGSRVLDVGASFGHFIAEAAAFFDVAGLELSEFAVKRSRELFGDQRNVVGSIYAPPEEARGPWDAVTLWDVIEHVPDPRAALHRIRELLVPGGRLYLSTPDVDSFVARVMAGRWHYIDPVQHIVLFGRQNLTRLLAEANFRVCETRSFGRDYRVAYVLDRLRYLYPRLESGAISRAAFRAARLFAEQTVHINAGDVVALAAVRV
jgi:SAM-dependent methyltransferase